MKHLGWKITFGLSWIPALLLYGNFISGIAHMKDPGTSGIAGGLTFFLLIIPVVLVLGLQTTFGFLAFRK